MKPTIGRTVHFYGGEHFAEALNLHRRGPFSATITDVIDEATNVVGLHVLLPSRDVPMKYIEAVTMAPEAAGFAYWEWPPRV